MRHPEEAYLAEVESSDIYIGVLGKRYGRPLKTRFSATHTEYLHAEKNALRIAMWTAAGSGREGHEQSFLDEARIFHVVPQFSTPDDFQRQVAARLLAIAAESGTLVQARECRVPRLQKSKIVVTL